MLRDYAVTRCHRTVPITDAGCVWLRTRCLITQFPGLPVARPHTHTRLPTRGCPHPSSAALRGLPAGLRLPCCPARAPDCLCVCSVTHLVLLVWFSSAHWVPATALPPHITFGLLPLDSAAHIPYTLVAAYYTLPLPLYSLPPCNTFALPMPFARSTLPPAIPCLACPLLPHLVPSRLFTPRAFWIVACTRPFPSPHSSCCCWIAACPLDSRALPVVGCLVYGSLDYICAPFCTYARWFCACPWLPAPASLLPAPFPHTRLHTPVAWLTCLCRAVCLTVRLPDCCGLPWILALPLPFWVWLFVPYAPLRFYAALWIAAGLPLLYGCCRAVGAMPHLGFILVTCYQLPFILDACLGLDSAPVPMHVHGFLPRRLFLLCCGFHTAPTATAGCPPLLCRLYCLDACCSATQFCPLPWILAVLPVEHGLRVCPSHCYALPYTALAFGLLRMPGYALRAFVTAAFQLLPGLFTAFTAFPVTVVGSALAAVHLTPLHLRWVFGCRVTPLPRTFARICLPCRLHASCIAGLLPCPCPHPAPPPRFPHALPAPLDSHVCCRAPQCAHRITCLPGLHPWFGFTWFVVGCTFARLRFTMDCARCHPLIHAPHTHTPFALPTRPHAFARACRYSTRGLPVCVTHPLVYVLRCQLVTVAFGLLLRVLPVLPVVVTLCYIRCPHCLLPLGAIWVPFVAIVVVTVHVCYVDYVDLLLI